MQASRPCLCLLVGMVLAALSMATDAQAVDYFVRKTGNDANAGTSPAAAWLTIDHAADNAAPGDTIYVGAGTYTELVFPDSGGTLALPIQLIADTDGTQTGDAGEVVIAAPTSSSMALYIVNISYVHVYGFKITGGLSRTIYWNNSDGGILDGCEITGSSYEGLYVYRSELNVRNCNIHGNGSNGINIPGSSGKNTLLDMTDCIISNNSGTGAVLSTQYVIVDLARCKIQNNATHGIYANGAIVTATNCLITGTTNVDGVRGLSSCNVSLRNCTIADNMLTGVYVYSGGTIAATNCVIVNNGQYGVRNSGGTITHTYNLFNGNSLGDLNGTTQDATDIVADPQFLSGGYQIPSTSPAVNAGMDLSGTVDDDINKRLRPYDGAWDIGCYEEGPVVHWKLDEISGNTAVDSSGLGNDGAYEDEPPKGITDAPYGTAVYFQDYMPSIYLAGNSTINDIESFTAAAWAKSDTATWNDDNYLLSKADGKFSLYGAGGGKLINVQIRTTLGNSYESFDLSSLTDFDLRRWHHYAASYDAVEGVMRLYVDGVLATSKSITSAPLASGNMNLLVNEQYVEMSATLDDVRLYDRRLTDIEVAKLYGLMGHWKMDEGVGTTAADSTAFSNDATLSGATWTADCAGKNALAFDGVSNTAATNAAFDPPGIGTVAFWMQASGTPTVRERIFGVNGNWEARHETTGKISFDLGASPYAGNEPFAADVVDDQDRWYHIVAAFNESDDSYEVYVNGELQASGISPVNLVTQSAGVLSFGTRTGSSENWKGSLRDFRIYNRWLTNDEISNLSGIIAHWNLEETSGTVAVDSGVAGNDASYVGAPVLGVNGAYVAKTGLAVELDGASTSVATGKSLLNNLTEFSLAAWIRPDSVTPNISILGQNGLIELGISSQTNQIEFWTNSGGSVTASGYLSLGRWAHVVAIGDGLSLKLYVNGAEVASGGSLTTSYGSNSAFFKIGEGVLAPSGDYFGGRVDDVRVYSRVMCLEEVRALYKGGRPGGVRILKWVEVR